MQHLGAVVGQLGGLGVGDFVQHFGVGHQARVGAHDAIDVGPDPELGGVERGGQNRRRKIGAAASERGGASIGGGAVEAGDDGHDAALEQRQQAGARLHPRGLHQRRSVAEDGVGDDDLPGVHGFGGRAFGDQVLGDQNGGEAFADGDAFIHRARRALAEHGHAVHDALELVDRA